MAIYAQRPRKRNSYLPEFKLISTPQDGEAFVYDSQIGAFVNSPVSDGTGSGGGGNPDPDLSNYVTGGLNLSNNLQIFKQKNNQKLEFKGLVAGGGITLNNMGNDIRIANTVFETGHWLNSGIDIVFQNNGKMTFYKRGHRFYFEPTISYTSPNADITIVVNNPGQIISATQNFEALGFFVGQKILVDGTDEQDGEWTIGAVNNGTITLTTAFNSNLDAGLQPPVTIKGSRLQFINSIRFAVYGIDLSQEDIAIGDTINIAGTENNDGVYTIQGISGNQIDVAEVFSGPFNSEYGEIDVYTPEEDLPIGLEFDDNGNITANQGTFQTIHTSELVTDNITVGGESLESYIESITEDLPVGGYLVSTDDGPVVREIEVGPGLLITDPDGYDANTKISVKDFFINLTGDAEGYAVVSGLANTNIAITLDLVGTPGQYNLVTVDNKGRVVAGTKRVITAGPGMTVVNGDFTLGDPVIHPNDFTITLDGDVQGSATVTDLGSVTIDTTLNLPNANMPTGQWFNRVQLNSMGWVTQVENQAILGSNGIRITNPDGVDGNPVISIEDFVLTANGDVTGQAVVQSLTDTTIELRLPELLMPGTFNQVTVDSTGRVVAGSNVVLNYQENSPELDELSSPSFNDGLVYWNGTHYSSKAITGQINQIDINESLSTINISIPDNPKFSGFESITIPYGPTHFRPSVSSSGMLRVNTDDTVLEAYINGGWRQFHAGSQDPSLAIQGGTMQGNINMGGNEITNVDTINGYNITDYFDVVDEMNSGAGIKVSTSSGIVNRSIQPGFQNGLTIINPDGVAGDPTILFSVYDFSSSSSPPDNNDEIIFHDISDNTTKKTTIENAFRRPARDYYMAQF